MAANAAAELAKALGLELITLQFQAVQSLDEPKRRIAELQAIVEAGKATGGTKAQQKELREKMKEILDLLKRYRQGIENNRLYKEYQEPSVVGSIFTLGIANLSNAGNSAFQGDPETGNISKKSGTYGAIQANALDHAPGSSHLGHAPMQLDDARDKIVEKVGLAIQLFSLMR